MHCTKMKYLFLILGWIFSCHQINAGGECSKQEEAILKQNLDYYPQKKAYIQNNKKKKAGLLSKKHQSIFNILNGFIIEMKDGNNIFFKNILESIHSDCKHNMANTQQDLWDIEMYIQRQWEKLMIKCQNIIKIPSEEPMDPVVVLYDDDNNFVHEFFKIDHSEKIFYKNGTWYRLNNIKNDKKISKDTQLIHMEESGIEEEKSDDPDFEVVHYTSDDWLPTLIRLHDLFCLKKEKTIDLPFYQKIMEIMIDAKNIIHIRSQKIQDYLIHPQETFFMENSDNPSEHLHNAVHHFYEIMQPIYAHFGLIVFQWYQFQKEIYEYVKNNARNLSMPQDPISAFYIQISEALKLTTDNELVWIIPNLIEKILEDMKKENIEHHHIDKNIRVFLNIWKKRYQNDIKSEIYKNAVKKINPDSHEFENFISQGTSSGNSTEKLQKDMIKIIYKQMKNLDQPDKHFFFNPSEMAEHMVEISYNVLSFLEKYRDAFKKERDEFLCIKKEKIL